MALGAKYENKNLRVYTATGDGEIQEGQIWEALMFAAHYKLDNLCVIVDNNNLQIDGEVSKVMSPYPIDEKPVSYTHLQTRNGSGGSLVMGRILSFIE